MSENAVVFEDAFGQSDAVQEEDAVLISQSGLVEADADRAALAIVEAEVIRAEVIPQQEEITKASNATGSWGEAENHNLSNGARASGDVLSAHSLLGPADLDWDPVFADLLAVPEWTEGGIAKCVPFNVPKSIGRAVVRSDTKQPIGVVGARYALIPHRKLADLADALVGVDGFRLHYGNAGHKNGGARPFIQLKSEPRNLGKARVTAIDVYDVITLMTGHDGGFQLAAVFGAVIVCCDNTYAKALGAANASGVFIRHTTKGVETVEEAIRIATRVRELGGEFDNRALQLMTSPFAAGLMEKLAIALIPNDTTKSENAREKLLAAYTDSPGALPGTKFGAAQAVTYYTSHEIGAREGTDRAFNLQTGEGTGSDMQAKAWDYLTSPDGLDRLAEVKLLPAKTETTDEDGAQ